MTRHYGVGIVLATILVIMDCGCASKRKTSEELVVEVAELSNMGKNMVIPPPQAFYSHFPQGYFKLGPYSDTALLPVNFMIIVRNNSSETRYLYDECFSDGHFDIFIDIKLNGKTYHLTKKNGEWTRNLPNAFEAIPPYGVMAIPVVLNEYYWNNCPAPIPGDDWEFPPIQGEMRVVLNRTFVKLASRQKPVNSGPVESKWTPVIFQGSRSYLAE